LSTLLSRGDRRGRSHENPPDARSRERRPWSKSQRTRSRGILGVIVKPAARFSAEHSGHHHSIEKRRRRVSLLAVLGEHDLGDFLHRVEPDEIEQGEWPHWMASAKLHSLVDVLHSRDVRLESADRVEHVRDEQQIHDEPGAVLRSYGLLAELFDEGESSVGGFI